MSETINSKIKEKLLKSINKNLSGINLIALDVGSGTGVLGYQAYHLSNKFQAIFGVELNPKEKLVNGGAISDDMFSKAANGNENLEKYVRDEIQFCKKIDFYNFYCAYVKEELLSIPVIKKEFDNIFKFTFGKGFKEYSNENTFDLIVLSRILHYIPKKEQISIIDTAIERLNSGGVIFIVNRPKAKETSIDLEHILKPLSNNFLEIDYDDKYEDHYFYTLVKR